MRIHLCHKASLENPSFSGNVPDLHQYQNPLRDCSKTDAIGRVMTDFIKDFGPSILNLPISFPKAILVYGIRKFGSVVRNKGVRALLIFSRYFSATDSKWRQYQSEVILSCVRWYCKYRISYRELEGMMLERGFEVKLLRKINHIYC